MSKPEEWIKLINGFHAEVQPDGEVFITSDAFPNFITALAPGEVQNPKSMIMVLMTTFAGYVQHQHDMGLL